MTEEIPGKRDSRFLELKDQELLPCIRCNKTFDVSYGVNHPQGATVFESYGQYGSTQFDPMDGSRLEINLCDPCVEEVKSTHIASFDTKTLKV